MDHYVCGLFDRTKRFLMVWRENPGSMVICYVIVALLSYAGISLADLASYSGYEACMLRSSLLCETGPYFERAAELHLQRLEDFKDYLDDQWLADIVGFLSDRYNPKKDLENAVATLRKVKDSGDQEKIARAIWQAGEQLEQFQMKAANFRGMKIALKQHPNMPDELLLKSINDALKESDQALKQFQESPALITGFNLCESNRDTMLRFVRARRLLISPSDDSQQLLCSFQEIVNKTIKAEQAYATDLPKPQKRMFEIFTGSENARLGVLNAITEKDPEEAYRLQCEAIEKAYHTRQEILELSRILIVEEESGKQVS